MSQNEDYGTPDDTYYGLKAENARLREECTEANREIERQGYKLSRQMTELARLRDLLNKDPDVDWQEMAKMLDEKDAELTRLREALEEIVKQEWPADRWFVRDIARNALNKETT